MRWLFKIVFVGLVFCAHGSGWAQARKEVLPFNEFTWVRLVPEVRQPTAYLFTTSYCSTCPDAFAVLHKVAQKSQKKIELDVVMMDVEGAQALKHARYFQGLSKLYAFDGFEPSIRQSIDPQWPNVTPYIVLLDGQGKMQKTIGSPSPDMLKKWLDF